MTSLAGSKAKQTKVRKGKKLLKYTSLLRYRTTNSAVATVSKRGVIKGGRRR